MEQKDFYLQSLTINRLMRIVGGIFKFIGFIYHKIFPNKRFILPKHDPSWGSKRNKSAKLKEQKISRILWQTNYTRELSLPDYLNYLFNRWMAFDYEYRFFDDEDVLTFIEELNDAKVLEAYKSLNIGAAKADFWRYLILHELGGVYLDIDACLGCPLSVAIRPETDALYCRTKADFTNFFMASVPKHQILKDVIEIVSENIMEGDWRKGVYHLTGPFPLNQAMEGKEFDYRDYKLICTQGIFSSGYFQYLGSNGKKWTKVALEDIFK